MRRHGGKSLAWRRLVLVMLVLDIFGCGSDTPNGSSTPARRWVGPVAVQPHGAWMSTLALDAQGDARVLWQQGGDNAGVWSRALVSGRWTDANPVETGEGVGFSPQIATNDAGVTFGVWVNHDRYPYGWLRAARRLPASRWEAPVGLNDGELDDLNLPQIAVFADGGALAVWEKSDAILANRFDPQSGWGSPVALGRAQVVYGSPLLWADRAGNALVLWFTGYGWAARRLDAGIGWGTVETPPGVGYFFESPVIAVRPGGEIDVMWDRVDSGTSPFLNTSVWANRFVPGSGWTSLVALAPDAKPYCRTALGADATGTLAVWGCRVAPNANDFGTWYSRLSAGGIWDTPRQVARQTDQFSMLASDGAGNSVGLWTKRMNASPVVLSGARLQRGGDWDSPQVITQSVDLIPLDLRLSVAGEGLAVWLQGTVGTDQQQIRSAQFADGKWREPLDVSGIANIAYPATSFSMALNASGDAVAVWDQNSPVSGVWSNQYVRP